MLHASTQRSFLGWGHRVTAYREGVPVNPNVDQSKSFQDHIPISYVLSCILNSKFKGFYLGFVVRIKREVPAGQFELRRYHCRTGLFDNTDHCKFNDVSQVPNLEQQGLQCSVCRQTSCLSKSILHCRDLHCESGPKLHVGHKGGTSMSSS